MADLGLGTVLAQLLGGGVSLYNSLGHGGTTDMGVAKTAAGLADPFASQRPGYQTQLHDLLTNPDSFKTDPGYQFALSQGQDAIKGAGNAIYGGTRAGAIYPELAKFTEGYASQSYDNRINQLMTAAGANSGSPGTAGALYAQGGQNANNDLGSGLNSLLSSLLGGAGNANGGVLGTLLQTLLGGKGGGSSVDPSGTNMGTGSITNDGYNMGTGDWSFNPNDFNMGTGDFGKWDQLLNPGGGGGWEDFLNGWQP